MKILMICEFYNPELQFQENQVTKYLRKQGHDVLILTSLFEHIFDYYSGKVFPKGSPIKIEDYGATIWKLPYRFNLFNKIKPYKNIPFYLNEFAPDLIYIHGIIPNTPEIRRYCRKHPHVRVVLDSHMDHSNSGKSFFSLKILHGLIRKYYLDLIRPQLSNIFPTHPGAKRFLNAVYGVPNELMEILPLGPDGDLIEQVRTTMDREAARNALGIAENDIVLVTGGKLKPRKRTELIIEAMQNPALSKLKLIIMGEFDPTDAEYQAQILERSAALGDRVKFVGWQNALGTYHHMLLSDIAIFPSSQSVMWQQSIGCALPLIVGDSGGQDPSYLNRNANMRIVAPDKINVQSFQTILDDLISNPDERQKMSAGAQKTFNEFLDWNIITHKITGQTNNSMPVS
jgi:glycosyltransferase involved in cell wall biosynthesis